MAGDPTSGEWKLIRLEAGELEAPPVVRASAANDTEVLVVVQETGSTMLSVEPTEDTPEPFLFSARYAAWIVNTIDETATRHVMPVAGSESAPSPQAAAEWFKDEWVVLFTRRVWVDGEDGWTDRNSLVMTADGISWRVAPFDDATLFNSVTSFTAGSTSMIADDLPLRWRLVLVLDRWCRVDRIHPDVHQPPFDPQRGARIRSGRPRGFSRRHHLVVRPYGRRTDHRLHRCLGRHASSGPITADERPGRGPVAPLGADPRRVWELTS